MSPEQREELISILNGAPTAVELMQLRNAALRKTKGQFYKELSDRQAAVQLVADLRRYQASPTYRRDRHSVAMPAAIRDTKQGAFWDLLRRFGELPDTERVRQIFRTG